jgi:hypothetical protein
MFPSPRIAILLTFRVSTFVDTVEREDIPLHARRDVTTLLSEALSVRETDQYAKITAGSNEERLMRFRFNAREEEVLVPDNVLHVEPSVLHGSPPLLLQRKVSSKLADKQSHVDSVSRPSTDARASSHGTT